MQWKDVDLKKISIHVCQLLDYINDKLQNGLAKSRERTLSIDAVLMLHYGLVVLGVSETADVVAPAATGDAAASPGLTIVSWSAAI